MRDFSRRPLTAGEIALARPVFGEEIAYSRVRVVQLGGAPWGAMVPVRDQILFGRWRAARDFSDVEAGEQGWFIHELAHCWQAARGVVLAAAKLSAIGASAYRLRLKPGASFRAYNIEQQAEIARFVFHARRGAPHPDGPPPTVLERLWPASGF
jgi:hypothetical protein